MGASTVAATLGRVGLPAPLPELPPAAGTPWWSAAATTA